MDNNLNFLLHFSYIKQWIWIESLGFKSVFHLVLMDVWQGTYFLISIKSSSALWNASYNITLTKTDEIVNMKDFCKLQGFILTFVLSTYIFSAYFYAEFPPSWSFHILVEANTNNIHSKNQIVYIFAKYYEYKKLAEEQLFK